jgi:hypothetical protein
MVDRFSSACAPQVADARRTRPLVSTISRMRGRCELCGDGGAGNGGAKRDRTADLLHAMQALSQLSYGPNFLRRTSGRGQRVT